MPPAALIEATSNSAATEDSSLSSGAYAHGLIHRQTRRLGNLQNDVLADKDPEALHQFRVNLRRLRTVLGQFKPALILPGCVRDVRIAAVARRTGLTRDLDVLRVRLEDGLVPSLPEAERKELRPALKRLSRDRQQAFEGLGEALKSPRYLKLLEQLNRWQRQPVFTALGEQPIRGWLFEWLAPLTAGLFVHPGWFSCDPWDEKLHDLRKQIKGVRYGMESLHPFLQPALCDWIVELKKAQDNLGELHDLQVLQRTIADRNPSLKFKHLPALQAEINAQQRLCWQHWQEQAERLSHVSNRHAMHLNLLMLVNGHGRDIG